MTPAERLEIIRAYLTDDECGTVSACARKFGRTRETIACVLKGSEFEQLQKEAFEEARRALGSNAVKFMRNWIRSSDIAAERGDHRPSRDALLYSRVIEPVERDGGSTDVTVVLNQGFNLPGITIDMKSVNGSATEKHSTLEELRAAILEQSDQDGDPLPR